MPSSHNLDTNLAIGSERQKLAYLVTLPEHMSQAVSLHVRSAVDDPAARELAVTAVLQRKGRVQDTLSNSFYSLRNRSSAEDQGLWDQLNRVTSRLARLVLNGPQDASAEQQKEINALEEQREKIEGEISSRSAEFRAQKQPITLQAVRRAIPDNAALIEFAIYRPFDPKLPNEKLAYGERHYVVYVIRRQGDVQWKELGPAREIDETLSALRRALNDPQRKGVQRLARTADEKIMQPVRFLLGDATQLLVSPDGELNLIPFAAMVDEQGHFLIEHYSVTYLTSGRDLLRLEVASQSKSPPLILADPAFGDPPLMAERETSHRDGVARTNSPARIDYSQVFFGPLPGVSEEVRALKELLPNARFLTREQATKAELQSVVAPSILHIATHGFFLSAPGAGAAPGSAPGTTRGINANAKIENPLLRSGLALAGANHRDESGILTALEAAGLNLWGTKLVVLSACDTGIGQVRNGEGVYGLRRALVLAGAETQLMSLWPVSDRATRDLMITYYRDLVNGHGRGDALRQAQLQMLHNKSHSHPYYWASFIQTGEWANLEGKR